MQNDLINREAAITAINEHFKFDPKGAYAAAVRRVLEALPEDRWIPVEERMPEEHDSIFARLYGTDKWRDSMFIKDSDYVLVTVEFMNRKRITQTSCTVDGEWRFNGVPISRDGLHRKVLAWKPFSEPYDG